MAYDRDLTGAGWIVQPIRRAIDFLSDAMPGSEATAGSPGSDEKAARGEHVHPRLTSAQRVALDAGGMAAVIYTRTFTAKPAIVLTAINPSGRQVQLEVVSDTMTGGVYTGCVIKGSRAQLLPALASVVLIGPLISALQNFDVLGGSAAGVEVSVTAIQPST